MSSCDPMQVAVDWLEAYRASSAAIIDLYDEGASLECGCGGYKTVVGRKAIAEYWRHRFAETRAGELEDIHPLGSGIVVRFRASEGTLQAILQFNADGKIELSRCGPSATITPLKP